MAVRNRHIHSHTQIVRLAAPVGIIFIPKIGACRLVKAVFADGCGRKTACRRCRCNLVVPVAVDVGAHDVYAVCKLAGIIVKLCRSAVQNRHGGKCRCALCLCRAEQKQGFIVICLCGNNCGNFAPFAVAVKVALTGRKYLKCVCRIWCTADGKRSFQFEFFDVVPLWIFRGRIVLAEYLCTAVRKTERFTNVRQHRTVRIRQSVLPGIGVYVINSAENIVQNIRLCRTLRRCGERAERC